jgi:predicted O-methyltransferase YrrM
MIASRAKTGILEIGRLRGGSTFVLASANQTVPIYSIDIDPKNDVELRRLFKEHGIGSNVELITGDSQKPLYPGIEKFDVLYIDGDHTLEGCANDIANWYDKLTVGGHMLFHDCFFGCEVQDAVLEFTSKHETTVVQTPYVGAEYWLNPTGSVAHLIKR